MINSSKVSSISAKAFLVALLPVYIALGCGTDLDANKEDEVVVNNPQNPLGEGPAPISLSSTEDPIAVGDLGAAGNYAILTKTGISNAVAGTVITGNIAVSPAAATYITGFDLDAGTSTEYTTSALVVGNVYAANYAVPSPSNLTTAVGSMETAYTDAAGRTDPDYIELASGDIGGLTLAPGLYKWGTSVTIPLDVTIAGGADDVWIFQIAGDLTMASAKSIILSGGAQAKNIFFQVAGQVTLDTTSHFEGIILCKTSVSLLHLASINGQLLAQTAVTLSNNAVTQPE